MSEPIDLDELRTSIRDVLDAETASERVHRHVASGAALDAALAATVGELGWSALAIPEAHGGLGLDFSALAILYEELGRGPAPLPLLPTMLVAQAIAESGDNAAAEAWLPRIAAGQVWGAYGDGAALVEEGGTLSGVSGLCMDGAAADLFILGLGSGRLALVDKAAGGIAVETTPSIDVTRSLSRVALKAARATIIKGDVEALTDHAALGLACDSIGGTAAILARTIEYLKTRTQFDRPIGSFQALKHRVASHALQLEAARALTLDAVRAHAARAPGARVSASLARALACEAYAAVADDAVQLHGGIGFTWEQDCHLFLKRARFNERAFGDVSAHLDRAAQMLLEAA